MVTGQEHVLLTATLDSQCHCDSCKVHQRVSLEVMEQRGLALVSRYFTTAIQHPGMSVKPSVPVEAFLSRDHVDMEGLLEWQFTRVLLISNSIPMEEDQCVMVKTLARISARS